MRNLAFGINEEGLGLGVSGTRSMWEFLITGVPLGTLEICKAASAFESSLPVKGVL